MVAIRFGFMLAVVLALGSSSAVADTAYSVFDNDGDETLVTDRSGEFLVDLGGSEAGVLDVGDILIAGFDFEAATVDGIDSFFSRLGLDTGIDQLTGLAVTKVISKSDPLITGNAEGTSGAYTFGFGALTAADVAALDAALGAEFDSLIAELETWSAGTVAKLYSDPDADFSRTNSGGADLATNLANVYDAGGFLELGFLSAPGADDGEFWVSDSPTDELISLGVAGAGEAGFAVGLNLTGLNTTGLEFLPRPSFHTTEHTVYDPLPAAGTAQFTGTGAAFSKGAVLSPYTVFNRLDASFNAIAVAPVPEPASWVAFSIGGLICLGAARRRQQAKSLAV